MRVDDDKEGEKSSPGVLERAVVEKARELESQIAAAPIPHGANDDLYGIPMLDIGSESEVSYQQEISAASPLQGTPFAVTCPVGQVRFNIHLPYSYFHLPLKNLCFIMFH